MFGVYYHFTHVRGSASQGENTMKQKQSERIVMM
jgi:hypothetical protein